MNCAAAHPLRSRRRTRQPRAMPVGNEPTTAIPVQSPKDQDATEKIDTREAADEISPSGVAAE